MIASDESAHTPLWLQTYATLDIHDNREDIQIDMDCWLRYYCCRYWGIL
jgi:hypothetical protein